MDIANELFHLLIYRDNLKVSKMLFEDILSISYMSTNTKTMTSEVFEREYSIILMERHCSLLTCFCYSISGFVFFPLTKLIIY